MWKVLSKDPPVSGSSDRFFINLILLFSYYFQNTISIVGQLVSLLLKACLTAGWQKEKY